MSDIELQTVLDFDQEDLSANRLNKLSANQKNKISQAQHIHRILFVGLGTLLLLAAVGSAWSLIFTATTKSWSRILLEIAIPESILVFLAWQSFQMSVLQADDCVRCVRGKVHFIQTEKLFSEKKPNGSRAYWSVKDYQLRVGDVTFENVNQGIFDILEQEDIYIVYYTKDSKVILSMEPIMKGNQ